MDEIGLDSASECSVSEAAVPAMSALRLLARPPQGWLRAVREARGLPRRVIAEELGVSDAAVRDYELAEVRDAISLGTFRRMAKVLGCELVVALVPCADAPLAGGAVAAAALAFEPRPRGTSLADTAAAGLSPRDGGELEEHLK